RHSGRGGVLPPRRHPAVRAAAHAVPRGRVSDPGGVAIGRHLVDGRELGYRRAGHGPPVLLLHDAVTDSRQWRPQLADLSDEFTVVAWDAPGCGGSFDPPATFTLADFADQAAALVRGLGLGSVHAVGLSFGAASRWS